MKNVFGILATIILLIGCVHTTTAQKDSTAFDNSLGVEVSYTGLSYLESAVAGFHITYTMKKHAVALGPHIVYHDLFDGQSDWARHGVSFKYEYFPIRSNRLFAPFIFYDLNYGFIKSRRGVIVDTDDGLNSYGAVREVVSNSIAHHFGIGTRCNFYKGFYLNLSVGGGPATFGQSVKLRSLQTAYSDTKEREHPFKNYETALIFRIGISYQVGLSELKKMKGCCD
mgnify:CR=1 FL=1